MPLEAEPLLKAYYVPGTVLSTLGAWLSLGVPGRRALTMELGLKAGKAFDSTPMGNGQDRYRTRFCSTLWALADLH